MREFLPLLVGALVGAAFLHVPRRFLPFGCLVGGATASSINGELGGPFWELFVSFDAAVVWLGAVAVLAVHRLAVTGTLPR